MALAAEARRRRRVAVAAVVVDESHELTLCIAATAAIVSNSCSGALTVD